MPKDSTACMREGLKMPIKKKIVRCGRSSDLGARLLLAGINQAVTNT